MEVNLFRCIKKTLLRLINVALFNHNNNANNAVKEALVSSRLSGYFHFVVLAAI